MLLKGLINYFKFFFKFLEKHGTTNAYCIS